MITGYIEYKNQRLENEKEMKMMKEEKIYTKGLIEDLHEIEEFEAKYPECMKRYEEETGMPKEVE